MIAHIVLFEPRQDLSADDRRRIFADLQKAAATIASVRRCRVGRRVLHGLPGYEQAMADSYGYAAIFEFDDVAGLRAYLKDPAHEAIGRHFALTSQRALAYDYEMFDAADAGSSHFQP